MRSFDLCCWYRESSPPHSSEHDMDLNVYKQNEKREKQNNVRVSE